MLIVYPQTIKSKYNKKEWIFYDWHLRNQKYKEEYSKVFLIPVRGNLVISIYYRKSKI